MPKVIAVDFDGTLFENDWPNIGAPRQNIIEAVLREQRNGAQLILWTCRTGEHLAAALAACEEQGIRFDAVNENIADMKAVFGGDTRKVCASEYWDDRAVDPDSDPRFKTAPATWVYDPNGYDWGIGAWLCSKCHSKNDNLPSDGNVDPYRFAGSRFCPNCGRQMLKEV